MEMETVSIILASAELITVIYQIVDGKIKDWRKLQEWYANRLIALRNEVQNNLETVNELLKNDTSTRAIYDTVIRKSVNSLRHKELLTTSNQFEPILGKILKKVTKRTQNKKDPVRIFWNIKDAADKLEDLSKRVKKLPTKYTPSAHRIMLKRRLDALQWRLVNIDEALKIVPMKTTKG